MGGVLDRKLSATGPVLALRQSAVAKISEREAERRDLAIASRVKKDIATQNAAKPYDSSTLNFEKTLLKIATKGVVKLFTAVAQQNSESTKGLETERMKRARDGDIEPEQDAPATGAVISELIANKREKLRAAPAKTEEQGASWMKDNYAIGQSKAWD